jgi:ElaB/YqjD/DUF883 family membrane-anchored ribosome-binding protein
MSAKNYLFKDGELRNFIIERENKLSKEIENYETNYILNVSVSDLTEFTEKKFRLEAPILREEEIYIDQEERKVDISQDRGRVIFDRNKPFYVTGTSVKFFVPFIGDSNLFRFRSSTFNYSPPSAEVSSNELCIVIETLDHDQERIKNKFNTILAEIKNWLEWVSKDVTQFNSNLKQKIEKEINSRRDKLLKDKKLVAGMGYPLKKRSDAPSTYMVPDVKRKVTPIKPAAISTPFAPEPTLSMSEYEHILNVIYNMSMVMERSPKAFQTMHEEDLRTHFLVQLNGQYEGQTTGETFNFEGKTDILIRSEGKNIFIAECKFWEGRKVLKETIDQLLGYVSWRDTKTAIVIFNRNKDLSNVLSQIPPIVKEHSNFKKQLEYKSETGFRFILHNNDDHNRELYLTILVFEVPK